MFGIPIPPWANPKNILLLVLALAFAAVGALYLIQRTTLATTKANYDASQISLATQTKNLGDCEENVKAVNIQYTATQKINKQTSSVREKIMTIMARHTDTSATTVKEPSGVVAESKVTDVQKKEMVIDNETQKKLDDLFDIANGAVTAFNSRVHSQNTSTK